MYRAERSLLAALGALALGLSVPTAVLAQEDPADEPKVEEKAEELVEEKSAEATEEQKADAERKKESEEMAEAQPMDEAGESLVAVAKAQGNLTRFVDLVEKTGLAAELSESGPFTIFAPTDDAFAALDQDGSIETKDPKSLRRLIRTHIAVGEWTSEELTGASEITNLLADELQLAWNQESGESGATRQVGEADVVRADIVAGNGVIHEIDQVLSASPAPEMNASSDAAETAGEKTSTDADDAGATD